MIEINEIRVTKEQSGIRLDKFLKNYFNNLSRNKIENYIKNGLILVNSKKTKPGYFLREYDLISFSQNFPQEKLELKPLSLFPEPDILYEDENILVINKPINILVHPTKNSLSQPSIVSWFLFKYPQIKDVGDDPLRPGIVHRLDKDTSGVLILTKNQKAFQYFKNLFSQRKIQKIYLVLVKGELKHKEGSISYQIGKAKDFPKRKVILNTAVKGKEALTIFKVIKNFKNYTLLEVIPKTGRTHQIRVHLASIGFPVLGDRLYGRIKAKEKQLVPRQMIHAFQISFPYFDNKMLSFKAPLPQDFSQILDQLTKKGSL
jgi:23S rRNA pseudouridine1911/1915/1917 synthase